MPTSHLIAALIDVFGADALDPLTDEEFSLLLDDLFAVANEYGTPHYDSPLSAAYELQRRIGGTDNLGAYVATLRP